MLIGSLMLFESPAPFLRLSLGLILPAVIVTALFFSLTVRLAYRAFQRKPLTGSEGLVGLEGKALTDITTEGGTATVHGEIWSALSDAIIRKGETIVVVSVSGLTIKVRKKEVG